VIGEFSREKTVDHTSIRMIVKDEMMGHVHDVMKLIGIRTK
jgi:hypothetical protein